MAMSVWFKLLRVLVGYMPVRAGTMRVFRWTWNECFILKKYGIAGLGALPAMNAYHYQDQGN
jgi:hypothetical protein